MFQTTQDKRSLRSALLLGAASAAVVGLSVPATAQETTETVVVTGSRIPQTGLYSSSPVTAVGQQEMKFEGTTNVENLINNLPQAFADFGDTSANGATGTATVNLRGLGSARTLVLIDGRRLMPGDVAFPVPDLNQIPAGLVDHIEVLTGGASAVYGSDAEAGVVNFIMRKDFEGVEFDGQYSIDNASNPQGAFNAANAKTGFPAAPSDWWGGRTDDATIIVGANSPNGKGNVTAYLGFRNTDSVLESKRSFSACSISAAKNANGIYDHHVCAGSANYNLWTSLDQYYAYGQPGGTAFPYLFQEGTGQPGSGHFVPYTGAPDQKFNYGPLNYLQRPDTRYTGGFFAHYQVAPQLDIYSQFMFTDDHSVAQIAQGGAFLGNYFTVNCSNPLMTATERHDLCSANPQNPGLDPDGCQVVDDTGNCNIVPGQASIAIGRRDIEGGFRTTELRHTAYRMVVGAKGDLGSGWSYDLYAQYGTTLTQNLQAGNWSLRKTINALNVDPATGQCFSAEAGGTDPNCVPLDIFNGFGSITPAMLNYVDAAGLSQGYTEEQIVSGSLSGDLGQYGIKSPWAKDSVGIALGGEYRAEYLSLNVDEELRGGDLFGNGGATLPVPRSGFNVEEGFGEVRVPLVQGMPWVEDLSVNGGYRYSSYNISGGVSSYKYGAEWQPIDDFRLRASYQRAVRAPNVLELFAPANVLLFGGQDPCAAPADATVLANCHNAGGVGHAQAPNAGAGILTCPAAQCNAQFGGNTNLVPERSDTRSVGIVLTPTFLSGFTATIDYFAIKVAGYMPANGETGLNPNTVLGACYGDAATAASQGFACPLVFRDPGTHSIHTTVGFVQDLAINAGALRTKGFDFEANYQVDLDDWGIGPYGSFAANFVGTKIDELQFTPVSGFLSFDCKGLFGVTCGTPTPEWRHKLRLTWSTPWDFDFSVAWRHLSGVGLDINTSVPLLATACGGPCGDLADAKIPAFDYFDLAVNWNVREGISLHAGVNNLFDKDPPIVDSNVFGISAPPFGNGNTFPQVYDSLGRTIFVGATIKY